MSESGNSRGWADETLILADELRGLAAEGLMYAANGYDRRRYERVLSCAARLAAVTAGRPEQAIRAEYAGTLDQTTPLIGVDSLVLEHGRLLLIQRTDNRLWCLPGGSAEVGETLAQAAERELREEAGIEGRARQVIGLFDSRLWHSGVPRHMVHVIFRVEPISGTPTAGEESLAVEFFGESDLPALSHGHRTWLPVLLARLRQGEATPFFDE